MQQMSLQLIHHQHADIDISQRAADGYIDATALCKAAGKQWGHYWALNGTQAFAKELATDIGIPISELIQSLRGGFVQGTWVHPQVAIHLGQWLSPKFAVMVTKWVSDWMNGKGAPTPAATSLPAHLHRYLGNDAKIPQGHFSILQEAALGLFGPLHLLGFDIPKEWVPDISVGQVFCAHLRENHNVDTDALPIYYHDYFDGRVVPAKIYPEALLPVYRAWFRTVWLPVYGIAYFKRKDKDSLPYLSKMPALAGPKTPTAKPLPWHSTP